MSSETVLLFLIGLAGFYVTTVAILIFGLLRLRPVNNQSNPTVSVIVAARNEAENLPACLDGLVQQDYPKELTQIVIVDDRSTDGTARLIEEFAATAPYIAVVQIKDQTPVASPKKRALAAGIAAASGELLLFTDADCRPLPAWISEMVACFDHNTGLVAGFSPLTPNRPGLFGRVLELNSMTAATIAAGSIGIGKPSTCTGRNLAYRRETYEEAGGFDAIAHSLSGDDDLFLQLVKKKTRWKIHFAFSPGSIIPASGVAGIREWWRQRRRHISAARYYSFLLQAVYFLIHLANLCLFVAAVGSLFCGELLAWPVVLLLVKLGIDFLALGLAARKLSYTRLLPYFPLWEIFFVLSNTLIGPFFFAGKIRWKD